MSWHVYKYNPSRGSYDPLHQQPQYTHYQQPTMQQRSVMTMREQQKQNAMGAPPAPTTTTMAPNMRYDTKARMHPTNNGFYR